MIRLLIWIALFYIIYKGLKALKIQFGSAEKIFRQSNGEIDDVMVQDPQCQVFFPKREGIHMRIDGEDVYFCSAECRDEYIKSRSEKT